MSGLVLTRQHAAKVVKVVGAGLCSGVGVPEPGKMCVEAAVCYALGLPHGDDPECVGSAVRAAKIALNDLAWSSDKARGLGMMKVAVAQLGSDQIDQVEFSKRLVLKQVNTILADMLESCGMSREAELCRVAVTLEAARSAAESAAWSAAESAAWSAELGDAVLVRFAGLILEVLVELDSPGVQWLHLCEEVEP